MRMHGSVFVNKSGNFNKEKAEKQLSRYAKDKKPMWLVIFPEGTRFNPELTKCIKKQKQFVESKGLEQLKYVLYPKTKALQVSVEQLRETLDSLYDITLAYSNTFDRKNMKRKPAPTMPDFLMGKSRRVHVNIKRIPISNVPVDPTELKDWLYERFYEKERLLDTFYSAPTEKEAKFPGVKITKSLKMSSLLPSAIFWGGTFALANSFKETRDIYWKTGLGLAAVGIIWMGIHH